jgi:type I restriction-modification system DNA methylase subunit
MKQVNFNKIVVETQDLIRNIDGLTGSDAFEEIIKIFFTLNLFPTDNLDCNNLKSKYEKEVYPTHDFFIGEFIKLKDITISQIIILFSQVDFNSEDVKGKLFETYLGRVFTSGLGQFFTPREIVEFMTGFLHEKKLIPTNAIILDPACGSSGILLKSKSPNTEKIVGYDINERLCRVSKMNMILHQITNSDIHNQSFLLSTDEEIYDVCVTNPPFGVEEKQKEILNKFLFGHDKKSCELEILFVEKIIKVLKPGGVCGIVLPDGVFNNVSMIKLREFILHHTEIIASIDLPENVFKSSGTGCETGILFFRKKISQENKDINFEAYKVEYVGYETKTKFAKKIPQNDLLDILKNPNYPNRKNVKEINSTKRIDGKYYIRKEKNKNKEPLKIFENSGIGVTKFYNEPTSIIRYVQYSDIDPVFGIIKSFTEFELSDAPSRAKIVVREGDILIPKLKQSLDKVAIVTNEFDGCVVTNGFKVIKAKSGYSPELIFAIFKNTKITSQLFDFSSGTIMPSVDDEFFEELVQDLPNSNFEKIEKNIKEIFKLINLAKDKMKNL